MGFLPPFLFDEITGVDVFRGTTFSSGALAKDFLIAHWIFRCHTGGMDPRKKIMIRVLIGERLLPIAIADIDAVLAALDAELTPEMQAAVSRGSRAQTLAKDVARLKPVRLVAGHPENQQAYLDEQGLALDDHCAVLGEWGDTKHYLIMNVTRGTVLRGIFHLDRFEEIPDDEL